MMNQVFSRLKLLFAKGEGLRIGADKVQVRVLDGEPLSNIERVEPYGFSYRPKAGCQTYLLFPHGDRSYGVAIVIGDKKYQMELQAGEVAIHDDENNYVLIKRGGVIEVKAATKVVADTPLFETTGDAKVAGDLTVLGQVNSTAGYYGADGGIGDMNGGLRVAGDFTVNGVDVSEMHTHTSHGDGALTSEVTDA